MGEARRPAFAAANAGDLNRREFMRRTGVLAGAFASVGAIGGNALIAATAAQSTSLPPDAARIYSALVEAAAHSGVNLINASQAHAALEKFNAMTAQQRAETRQHAVRALRTLGSLDGNFASRSIADRRALIVQRMRQDTERGLEGRTVPFFPESPASADVPELAARASEIADFMAGEGRTAFRLHPETHLPMGRAPWAAPKPPNIPTDREPRALDSEAALSETLGSTSLGMAAAPFYRLDDFSHFGSLAL